MNVFDFYAYLTDPALKLKRMQARKVLSKYEAAQPTRGSKGKRDNSSPNTLVGMSAAQLRAHARFLERNHDLTRGALRVMVNNVVGPNGIGNEPQPRRNDGTIHTEFAAELLEAHRDWVKRPEVTHRYRWPLAQRLTGYTWLRDGEAFGQQLVGNVPLLEHGTRVPFSLELFEPDFVPLDYDDPARNIRQGIQCNAWGRPTNFYVYKGDPREQYMANVSDLKPIPASRMLHVATIDRLHQLRGVSEMASVITRIEDLKDYEESERIAAKVAASLTAYVKRNAGSDGMAPTDLKLDANGRPEPRDLRMQPGMVIDSLLIGEEVGLIDSNRPNPNLIGWRAGQLRAFCAGIGASYSSVSRDYDGTYSAQRQELVEQFVHYAVLADEFVSMFVQPVWETFVATAVLSGVVKVPADLNIRTIDDCLFVGQSMPWIDPLKEALAFEKLTQAGFASEVEVIRRRGGNPHDTMQQILDWRTLANRHGLTFSSNAATMGNVAAPAAPANDAPGTGEEGEDKQAKEATAA